MHCAQSYCSNELLGQSFGIVFRWHGIESTIYYTPESLFTIVDCDSETEFNGKYEESSTFWTTPGQLEGKVTIGLSQQSILSSFPLGRISFNSGNKRQGSSIN